MAVACDVDILVFNPDTIIDAAAYQTPMQVATRVSDVLVNGVQGSRVGEQTEAEPGREVRGPGWSASENSGEAR